MFAIILLVLTIWVFIRTLSYGIYEIKNNNNKLGGIATIVIAVISLVFPNIIILINGFY